MRKEKEKEKSLLYTAEVVIIVYKNWVRCPRPGLIVHLLLDPIAGCVYRTKGKPHNANGNFLHAQHSIISDIFFSCQTMSPSDLHPFRYPVTIKDSSEFLKGIQNVLDEHQSIFFTRKLDFVSNLSNNSSRNLKLIRGLGLSIDMMRIRRTYLSSVMKIMYCGRFREFAGSFP